MARFDFGGTLADFVVTSHRLGTLDTLALSAATLTMWSAQSGGTRYTDLVLNGSAVSSIVVGSDGQVPKFQGPDAVTEMWADGGAGRVRVVTLQGAPGPAGRDGAPSTVPGPPGPAVPADQLASISASVASQLSFVEDPTDPGTFYTGTPGVGTLVAQPLGLGTLRRTFGVRRVGTDYFTTDYDMQADRPPVGVTYYAAPAGTGDGTSPATPCTLRTAYTKTDVGTIICAAGTYWWGDDLGQILKSVNIIGAGIGQTVLTGWLQPSTLTWTASGTTNVYQATITANTVQVVADFRTTLLTDWGDVPLYSKKADLASITAPGQWAQVGTTLYVRALGDANLVTDASFMRVCKDGRFNGIWANGVNRIYVEGIEFQAGGWASANYPTLFASNTVGTFLTKSCRVRYGSNAGFFASGTPWVAHQSLRVSSCQGDGIGYDAGGGVATHALEIGCTSHHNVVPLGDPTANTINSSTSHNGCLIVRLNGVGYHCKGPIFADVLGSKSWNLGCTARDSDADAAAYDVGFQNLAGTSWYDTCDASGNGYGFNAGPDGTINIHARGPGQNTTDVIATGNGVTATY